MTRSSVSSVLPVSLLHSFLNPTFREANIQPAPGPGEKHTGSNTWTDAPSAGGSSHCSPARSLGQFQPRGISSWPRVRASRELRSHWQGAGAGGARDQGKCRRWLCPNSQSSAAHVCGSCFFCPDSGLEQVGDAPGPPTHPRNSSDCSTKIM